MDLTNVPETFRVPEPAVSDTDQTYLEEEWLKECEAIFNEIDAVNRWSLFLVNTRGEIQL